jgi:hypothetical protein
MFGTRRPLADAGRVAGQMAPTKTTVADIEG